MVAIILTSSVSQGRLSEYFLIKYFPSVAAKNLPNWASQWNCEPLPQATSDACCENNNREKSSVSYLAVGILSERASGRTG